MAKSLCQYPEFSSSPEHNDILRDRYSRPNFDAMLSPLSSTNFSIENVEKERKARKKIRYLLDEQAIINEQLADENEILNVQQKSLLKLLITKDKQLESLAASLSSTLNTSENFKEMDNCETQTIIFDGIERIITRKLKSAWKRFELGTWAKIKERMEDQLKIEKMNFGAMYLKHILVKNHQKNIENVWREFQKPIKTSSYLPRIIIRIFEEQMKASIFKLKKNVINRKITQEKARNFGAKIYYLLQSHSYSKRSLEHCFKKWSSKQDCSQNVKILGKVILNLLRNQLRLPFGLIYKSSIINIIDNLKQENQAKYINEAETEIDTFVKENSELKEELKIKLDERDFLQSELDSAKQKIKEDENEIQESMIQNAQLKNQIKKLQDVLAQLQADKSKFQTNDIEQRKQIISMTSALESLEEDKEKLFGSLSQANEEIMDLRKELKTQQNEKDFFKNELDTAKQKIKEYEDERQVSVLQNAQLKGQIKKIQDMFAQLQTEKSKFQANDIEQRKQIISLSSAIENLEEDKEQLFQKLSQANEEITDLRVQINECAQSNELLSSNLQFYMKQEKEIQKHLKESEDEIESKSNLLYQKENDLQKLNETNQSLRNQLNQVKKEIENLQQNPDKNKIKQLIKENSQLNAKIEELQKSSEKRNNKEIAELKGELKKYQEISQQANHDNSLLHHELELVTNELNSIQEERNQLLQVIKEKQTIHHQKSESQVQAMRDYCNNLEQKVQSLQTAVNKSKKYENEVEELKERNESLEEKVAKLQAELEEVNEVAITSRKQIVLVTAEIENYASIFGIMEEKITETEERLKKAEHERDMAKLETQTIRQRYINKIDSI
ncbi:unnamed protein product [Blepharisma stoltei]|uniref:Uncharacterized protein n=1 Tax=Blepharisma stoltei TaxID=1481888 RepID=A0AAU9ISI6_9CILI|nr:unnamed protein product [Blepharisma stoltei]